MKLDFSQQIFKNTQISNFMKMRPMGAELFHADRRTGTSETIVFFLQRPLMNTWRTTVPLWAAAGRSSWRRRQCHFVSFNTHSHSVISFVFLFREVNKFLPFIFPASKEITAPEEKSSGSSYQWASPITGRQFVREEGGVGQYRKGWFFLRSSFSFFLVLIPHVGKHLLTFYVRRIKSVYTKFM